MILEIFMRYLKAFKSCIENFDHFTLLQIVELAGFLNFIFREL